MDKYRSVFISDTHIGGPCNYNAFYKFLQHTDADTWYIVGDFIDFWAIRRFKNWPNSASLVIQKILRKAAMGQKFIILPGNHDSELRKFENFKLGNIEIVDKIIHVTADNRRFLLLHGDIFDSVIGHAEWLARAGAVGYDILVMLNQVLNGFRKILRLPFWSFSAAIKRKVKSAVSYVSNFQISLQELAKQNDVNGVICGHIHTPVMSDTYINCGDWVESLTAVTEDFDGKLDLRYYREH